MMAHHYGNVHLEAKASLPDTRFISLFSDKMFIVGKLDALITRLLLGKRVHESTLSNGVHKAPSPYQNILHRYQDGSFKLTLE